VGRQGLVAAAYGFHAAILTRHEGGRISCNLPDRIGLCLRSEQGLGGAVEIAQRN
jgi:hypothetical protein